jgi:hypothetical protein
MEASAPTPAVGNTSCSETVLAEAAQQDTNQAMTNAVAYQLEAAHSPMPPLLRRPSLSSNHEDPSYIKKTTKYEANYLKAVLVLLSIVQITIRPNEVNFIMSLKCVANFIIKLLFTSKKECF